MPSEPVWLTAAQLILINRQLVAATGEPFVLRDKALLESACARPQNHWSYGERDMAKLICALLFGVARNHPFAQGNKRTAFAAAVIFAEGNGYVVDAPDTAAFADQIVAVIDGSASEAAFVTAFRDFLVSATTDRP